MYKKIQALALCMLLSVYAAACSGQASQDLTKSPLDLEQAQEPILPQDATDDELLEVLKDDITVVTDDDYIEMIAAFTEHTEEHAGKIYQLEGIYTVENGIPYVARTIVDGEDRDSSGLPLKYVPEEPKEGTWVRVTGIVNQGEVNGEMAVVLEVVVLQRLDEQGQAELPAQE